MRRETVATIKGRSGRHIQQEPREGTDLRTLYDALMAVRGDLTKLVPAAQFVGASSVGPTLEHLRNDYLLDIRSRPGRRGGSCLVGQWDGDRYIDYVTERMGLG